MQKYLLKFYNSVPLLQKGWRLTKHKIKKMGFFNPFLKYAQPGHYNSPLPSYNEILENKNLILCEEAKDCPGIDLNEKYQLKLLKKFSKFNNELPFIADETKQYRYYYNNIFFSKADATVLNATMREFKPSRIIEMGSGFSSALMLDANDLYFEKSIDFTFIEPFPKRLNSLLTNEDQKKCTIIEDFVQEADLKTFGELEKNDILFIDSSHVLKIGSDLSRIFFSILPRLRPGVIVHFHDIFWPFEYPLKWYYQGRAYNETHVLRTFLQYNEMFEILFFPSYLHEFHHKALEKNLPNTLEDYKGGASIYIRKKE